MALAEYGNAFNIDTDGSGNPILIDPQSGDTIAIYDRGTSSWQVTTIEATTGDFDSLNTQNQNIVGLSDGSAFDFLRYDITNPQGLIAQETQEVGTTTTTVLGFDLGSNIGGLAIINGGSGTRNFTDVVAILGFGTPVVIGESSRSEAPTRSYSTDRRQLQITLSNTGSLTDGTTDISVLGITVAADD